MAATIQDLNAALAAQDNELQSLAHAVGKVSEDIAALRAQLEAGAQVDVSAQLAHIQANTDAVKAALSALEVADQPQ